jgi:hypothetical protein
MTVEPAPLPVDATAAAALCGEHLRTSHGWDAAVVRTAGHQQPLDAI